LKEVCKVTLLSTILHHGFGRRPIAAAETKRLLDLARRLSAAERERLALGLLSLRAERFARGGDIPAFLDALLQTLVMEASAEARARLASRLAGSRWAPPALAQALAQDELSVAEAVILKSPHLKDYDLLRLFTEGDLDRQLAIARRPGLSAPLVEAVMQTGEPALLTALAGNDSVQISHDAMRRLVEASRQHCALRTPLARHPRLTQDLAHQLGDWASEPQKALLAARFVLRPQQVGLEPVEETPDERVIDKLEKAGQLRLGYLLEALQERRLSLFVAALARLGGFTAEEIGVAIESDRPELLGLACAAVGVDQQVFPTILTGVRSLSGGLPGGGAEGARKAVGAFAPFEPAMAARAFHRAVAAV
jgi:uncharacterized protein (DUF2336 family)